MWGGGQSMKINKPMCVWSCLISVHIPQQRRQVQMGLKWMWDMKVWLGGLIHGENLLRAANKYRSVYTHSSICCCKITVLDKNIFFFLFFFLPLSYLLLNKPWFKYENLCIVVGNVLEQEFQMKDAMSIHSQVPMDQNWLCCLGERNSMLTLLSITLTLASDWQVLVGSEHTYAKGCLISWLQTLTE